MTELEHSHEKAAIKARLSRKHRPSYVRDFIYGGIDGAVTNFAIVAGVTGAALSANIILILGIANLLADGFSMAASNYSGTKTVIDDVERYRAIEEKHIRLEPEGEREEIRQILKSKGLSGETLEKAVVKISADKDVWVEMMLAEEYGLSTNQASPLLAGAVTFAAFVICGAVPLLPFVFNIADSFYWSTVTTGIVFFGIGAVKSRWSLAPWWRSGLETLLIGGVAAAVAYAAGHFLRGIA